MLLSPYAPEHVAASMPAIEHHNRHVQASADVTYVGVPAPLLPANAIRRGARPSVVRVSFLFRNSLDTSCSASAHSQANGVEHVVAISHDTFLSAIKNESSSARGTPMSCFVLQASIDTASVNLTEPFAAGCVRFETRRRVPPGLVHIMPNEAEQPQREWVNHLNARTCLVDKLPHGVDTTPVPGIWFTRGHPVSGTFFSPPIVSTQLAAAYATSVVYPNPYVKQKGTDWIYTQTRARNQRFDFKEQASVSNDAPSAPDAPVDIYQFADTLDRRTRMVAGELHTMSSATPDVALAAYQQTWWRCREYLDPIRNALIVFNPTREPDDDFARIRVITFGAARPSSGRVVANALFSIKLDLDLLVFF